METDRTPADAKRIQMHGKDWDGRDVSGWYASEKMDGCRAYWDGASLYTKEGNHIDAPHITNTLPKGVALDGELWAGRGRFEAARLFTQHGKNPGTVGFVAFDAPGAAGDWPDRLAFASSYGVAVVKVWTIHSMDQLQADLIEHLQGGAEGLMVRLPGRPYKPGRSSLILKVKIHSLETLQYLQECEA